MLLWWDIFIYGHYNLLRIKFGNKTETFNWKISRVLLIRGKRLKQRGREREIEEIKYMVVMPRVGCPHYTHTLL